MPLGIGFRLLAALLLVFPLPALAACTASLKPISFGTIEAGRASRGTGEIVVRCDRETDVTVGIARGGKRRLSGPRGARLDYFLFADPAHALPWGDGHGAGPGRLAHNDGRRPTRLTVYAVIPAQPNVLPGDYDDSPAVTLSY